MTRGVKRFENAAETSFKKSTTAFDVFKGALSANVVLGAFNKISNGIISGINSVVDTSKRFEALSTQFQTLTQSAEVAEEAIQNLAEFSARTPFQFEDIAEASKTLLGFGFTADELIPILEDLGDVSAGLGQPIGEIATIFGQVSAAGKLTGERLLQLQERGVPVVRALADEMGVLESSVSDLVSKGKVDFETFARAFGNLNSEGNQFFQGMIRQSKTLGGVLSTLGDNFSLVQKDIGDAFLPGIKEASIAVLEFIQDNRELIRTLSVEVGKEFNDGVRAIIESLKEAKQFYQDNQQEIDKFGQSLDKGVDVVLDFAKAIGTDSVIAIETFGRALLGLFNDIETVLPTVLSGASEKAANFANLLSDLAGRAGLESVQGALSITSAALASTGERFENEAKRIGEYNETVAQTNITSNETAETQKALAGFLNQGSAALDRSSQALMSYQETTNQTAASIQGEIDAINASATATEEGNKRKVESNQQRVEADAAIRAAEQELLREEEDLKLAERQLRDEEELQRIADVLGQEEALKTQAEINRLKRQGKFLAAQKKARELEEKAEKQSIFRIEKFEELSQKQRLANLKSTLGVMATLTQSGNSTLFAIGKAAAIATATVDGFQAVQKALASAPPPLNFGLAAAVGAATAANVAKIASTRAPSFQDGGIVGGPINVGGQDNTFANVASGELILNRRQQANLFEIIRNGAPESQGTQLEDQISNLADAIRTQPIVVEIGEAELARAVRDTARAGFIVS